MGAVGFGRWGWPVALALGALAVAGVSALMSTSRVAAAPTPQEGKATVGDIEVSYRIQGQGAPLLLIMGLAGTMDIWDPTLLGHLTQHYRVITFDNRGIGGTTIGTAPFTIPQLADDTAGLMEALGIDHAFVLGWSLGSHVAQELVLKYPQRVDRLILYASLCGGPEAIRGANTMAQFTNTSGGPLQRAERLLNLILPPEWVRTHLPYVLEIFVHPLDRAPQATIDKQVQAEREWAGTCDRLGQVTRPTLVVTGTDDQATPPANSLLLAERIPNAWLAYFTGGGHGLMYQYPDQFAATIGNFLEAP
jgi:pimeloyl-ACP methyl ester carboxylesterase